MDPTIDVSIPVAAEVAAALQDERNRYAVGRLVSSVLSRERRASELAKAIAEVKADARTAGLTDGEIDAELDAYNAERRDSARRR